MQRCAPELSDNGAAMTHAVYYKAPCEGLCVLASADGDAICMHCEARCSCLIEHCAACSFKAPRCCGHHQVRFDTQIQDIASPDVLATLHADLASASRISNAATSGFCFYKQFCTCAQNVCARESHA